MIRLDVTRIECRRTIDSPRETGLRIVSRTDLTIVRDRDRDRQGDDITTVAVRIEENQAIRSVYP